MKKVIILLSFDRSIARFDTQDKKLLAKSLEAFDAYLVSGRASYGFRMKKIAPGIYEFRVDLKIRVIVKVEAEGYYLVLAGDHDKVKKYLRDYR